MASRIRDHVVQIFGSDYDSDVLQNVARHGPLKDDIGFVTKGRTKDWDPMLAAVLYDDFEGVFDKDKIFRSDALKRIRDLLSSQPGILTEPHPDLRPRMVRPENPPEVRRRELA
jgi:hypothetical protein